MHKHENQPWYNIFFLGDPCNNYMEIFDHEGLLSAGKTLEGDPTCHRPLDHRWYRIFSPAGTEMPSSCVPRSRCSTIHPVWANGTL